MKPSQKMITSLLMLFLFLSACAPQAESVPPTATQVPAPTATETPIPTPTPLSPMLMVGGDLPCYSGPGPGYETSATISIGMKAEVLNSNGEYWVIKAPDGNSQCWVEAKYSTIIGQAETIPTLSAEAVPTKALILPDTPTNFAISATCVAVLDAPRRPGEGWGFTAGDNKTFYVKLAWHDGNKETGYRIYKDGVLLVELEKNAIEYTDIFIVNKNLKGKFVYTLEAFNDAGASPTVEFEFYPNVYCK